MYNIGMKSAAIFITAIIASLLSAPVSADTFVTYAYLPTPVILYDAQDTPVCTLPATYFVVLCGDSSGGKYPVNYSELSGYVKAAEVETVDYEPVTKFPKLTAKVNNDGMAINLRDTPGASGGKIICTVPPDAVLTLYGSRQGEELFTGAGSVWQYVRYTAPDSTEFFGYAYSPQLKCDPIKPNVIEKVVKEEPPTANETPSSFTLSDKGNIILAVAMCVPAGIIMLIIFYRPDSARTPRHSRKSP